MWMCTFLSEYQITHVKQGVMAFCAVGGVNLHPGDTSPEYAPKRRIFSTVDRGNEKRPGRAFFMLVR